MTITASLAQQVRTLLREEYIMLDNASRISRQQLLPVPKVPPVITHIDGVSHLETGAEGRRPGEGTDRGVTSSESLIWVPAMPLCFVLLRP